VQVAAVRFALAVEQLGHVYPLFLAGDALVEPFVELSFDEAIIDFGGSNFAPDMRVSGRVRVDALELLMLACYLSAQRFPVERSSKRKQPRFLLCNS